MIDAMAIILAVALMLSARGVFLWSWSAGIPFLSYSDREVTRHSAALALVGLSFALLPFLLARSGDRLRLRRGAPGLVVHLVVVMTFGWLLVEWGVRWLVQIGIWKNYELYPFHPLATGLVTIIPRIGMPMSLGIAMAWTTLAVVGRWRADRGWDDRLGRFVGVLWLLCGPGETVITALIDR